MRYEVRITMIQDRPALCIRNGEQLHMTNISSDGLTSLQMEEAAGKIRIDEVIERTDKS